MGFFLISALLWGLLWGAIVNDSALVHLTGGILFWLGVAVACSWLGKGMLGNSESFYYPFLPGSHPTSPNPPEWMVNLYEKLIYQPLERVHKFGQEIELKLNKSLEPLFDRFWGPPIE